MKAADLQAAVAQSAVIQSADDQVVVDTSVTKDQTQSTQPEVHSVEEKSTHNDKGTGT